MRSLLLMAICCLCGAAVSDDFLKIELNGQLERLYGNNSDDISLETDQKEQQSWDIGEPSNHDEPNDIPSGLSERSYQKYNRLLHKLKYGKVFNEEQVAPTEIGGLVPTTEKMKDQVQTSPTTLDQPRREEIFPEEITDVDEDYDIIIMDETRQLQPLLAPSGVGFFHGLINFVRWLITSSAYVEHEDYEDDSRPTKSSNRARTEARKKEMSGFSSILQSLHTIFGKGVLGTSDNAKAHSPAKQEWLERKAAVMKPGKRSYIIKSLWHVECSRCDHYLYQTEEEVEQEQGRLCVENYRTAFRALKDCFDGVDSKSGRPWKMKYPALASHDNVKVIKTLQKKWVKMFPSLDVGPVAEDMKFLLFADPYFQRACHSQLTNKTDSFLVGNYQKVIQSLAKIAAAVEQPKMAELILLYVNEREFSLESNEPYTVTCWDEPAYAFLGGPLTERQLKWMKFAINVAHVPEKESDRIRYEHDDEETPPESSENVEGMAPSS